MAWSTETTRVNGDVVTAAIWNQANKSNPDALYTEASRAFGDIANAFFDVWERGTSFTPTANTKTYTADKWHVNIGTGGVATISRQAHTPGAPLGAGEAEPAYLFRWLQSTGGTGALTMGQPIEGARTRAGETVTVVFIAKVSSGTLSVTPKVVQKFGTGGSPSSDVTSTGSAKTVTTTFTKFTETFTLGSVSGKTFGSNLDDSLEVQLSLPTSTTFTLDVGVVALMPGTNATAVVGRPRIQDTRDLLHIASLYYANIANSTTIASTADETAFGLAPTTFPADSLKAGEAFETTIGIRFGTSGTPTGRVKLKFGASIVFDTTDITLPNNVVDNFILIRVVTVVRTIGAAGTAYSYGGIQVTGQQFPYTPGSVAVDTTAALAPTVTFDFSASSASNTAILEVLTIERL